MKSLTQRPGAMRTFNFKAPVVAPKVGWICRSRMELGDMLVPSRGHGCNRGTPTSVRHPDVTPTVGNAPDLHPARFS